MFLCLRPSRSRSPIPSLAPWWSPLAEGLADALWLCPERALRLFSLRRSRLLLPFALSPLSRRVLVDVIRPLSVVALVAGASPHALGFAVAPPISPVLRYTPWGSGRCLVLLPARLSASIHGDCLVSLPDLYVSQLKVLWGCAVGTHDVTSDWVDLGPFHTARVMPASALTLRTHSRKGILFTRCG